MLTDNEKTSTLWKSYKGWGSTHAERATFEELYRSYKEISTDSVLTYGYLLPTKETDTFYDEVKELDSTNDVVFYRESSFKVVPLIKKHTNIRLQPISKNCNHTFVVVDEDGNQIKNIIPFDFSDTGLYNYTLTNSQGHEIPWGICDWTLDVNSSLLSFSNGIPNDVSAVNPPLLTFYQYIGPVGERHYIDAILLDVEKVHFSKLTPFTDVTENVKNVLEGIEPGFFDNYGFKGSDLTQGVGLQFNTLTNVTDSASGDVLKGYDDNSQAQVVQLLSHLKATSDSLEILFVSEGVELGKTSIDISDEKSTESFEDAYVKIDLETGFIVAKKTYGHHNITIEEGDSCISVLLVKDNESQDYELFYPREDLDLTIKVPTFVDLIHLPPHLKLTTLSSYSDHIVPQYYGPRVADFVVACENSINWRSADFIVYNKSKFYLTDAIDRRVSLHIFLRAGTYENADKDLVVPEKVHIQGESKNSTVISNIKVVLTDNSCIENVTFENCTVTFKGAGILKNCNFENTEIILEDTVSGAVIKDCIGFWVSNEGAVVEIFNSTFDTYHEKGGTTFIHNSTILTKAETTKLIAYSTSFKEIQHTEDLIQLNACSVDTLNVISTVKESIINTNNIRYVENLPEYIKIDSNYIEKFSDKIRRPVYPDVATIPYYTKFQQRVYAKLPNPFKYNDETNEIIIKLDTIENTLFINDRGEIQCRFFSGKEIYLTDPDGIKTQIEDVYQEHADTVLETSRPENAEDAIVDLYWSKADLKNGKVPISQLPDSVAYGGLQFVGMWSFEDSEGKYPTFADCDLSFASDDEYTGLQNGWFFIVEASHKEDDPVYPQTAEDDVEFTAGDWVIYTGGKRHVIDYSKPLSFEINGIKSTIYSTDPENGLITYSFTLPNKNSDKTDTSSSTEASNEFGTITVRGDGIVTTVYNLPGVETDILLKDVKGFKLIEAQYKQHSEGDSWVKLDRAYLDPVYSRLPEFAVVTDGENPAWSVEDGGTGYLRLSYLSLAEALRLINETLWKLSPDIPVSIKQVIFEIDEEKTTAKLRDYIEVAEGLQLNQLAQNKPKQVYDSKSGYVSFRLTNQLNPNYKLPLENVFYSGESSTINVYDNETDITENCNISRFDPYEAYKLGFRPSTHIRASSIDGRVKVGEHSYLHTHEIKASQYDIVVSPYVDVPKDVLEGESQSVEFTERKFYELNTTKIVPCKDETINIRVLNNALTQNRTGGYSYLTPGTKVTGTFVIEEFIKYGIITPDANIRVYAYLAEKEIPVKIETQTLVETDHFQEVYSVNVGFTVTIPEDIDYVHGDLIVKAEASGYGLDTPSEIVLDVKHLTILNPELLLNEKESGGSNLHPTFGDDILNEFGADYTKGKTTVGLPYGETGYGWPKETQYLTYFSNEEPLYETPDNSQGTNYKSDLYRFVTVEKSFDEIHDLCGFNVHFTWDKEPSLDDVGLYKNIILQVCPRSSELNCKVLLNGNEPVPVFFETDLKADTPCNHPGKSNSSVRRITFGRKPLPVKDIYLRIGISKQSKVSLKNVEITED